MSIENLLSPIDYQFINIDGQEYLMPDFRKDELFDRYAGISYPCSSVEDFICTLAKIKWGSENQVIPKISKSPVFQTDIRKAGKQLTVAIYYRSISNGGAQRITAVLANLWAAQKDNNNTPKYHILLITDEPEQVEDDTSVVADNSIFIEPITEYEVSGMVQREYLPPYKNSVREKYRARYCAWKEIVSKYDVDIVVSGLWNDTCTFWDMLSVKSQPTHPAFILQNHNFCCVPFRFRANTAQRLCRIYEMCDAVVVLSETDREFADKFSSRSVYIPNPISCNDALLNSLYERNTILWVGRFAYEKRPEDAVKIINRVCEKHPEVKLYMVGTGPETIVQRLLNLISKYGLEENVMLTGFTEDVDRFYKRASLLLSTSEHEGFPTVMSEAFSYGIPIIQYELPWLSYTQDSRGVVTVPQGDIEMAAKKICELLDAPEQIRIIGQQGKQKLKEFREYDVMHDWEQLFSEVVTSGPEAKSPDMLMQLMVDYQEISKAAIKRDLEQKIKNLKQKNKELSTKEKRLTEERQELLASLNEERRKYTNAIINITNSKSYRIGRLITAPVRWIKNTHTF